MKDITPLACRPYVAGQKITEPGIYEKVPMQLYHGDICDGPSISSSGLRKIELESAEHFYEESYLNPDFTQPPPKEAWVFGRAAHTLLLGEEGFREDFCIRPETYPDGASWPDPSGVQKPWHGGAKWCKAWLAQAERDKLQVLKPDDIPKIRAMAEKLARHPDIQQGILNGQVERSIFWFRMVDMAPLLNESQIREGQAAGRITPEGAVKVWLKARPDAIPTDSNMIVDYKTCDDAGPLAVRRSITDYGYHMQLGLAAEGIMATTGRMITDHVLVFQEKGAKPHSINVKPIPLTDIELGRRQNWRSIQKFAVAIATGVWAGYEDDGVEGGLMDHTLKRLAKEAEEARLPIYEPPASQLATAVEEAV